LHNAANSRSHRLRIIHRVTATHFTCRDYVSLSDSPHRVGLTRGRTVICRSIATRISLKVIVTNPGGKGKGKEDGFWSLVVSYWLAAGGGERGTEDGWRRTARAVLMRGRGGAGRPLEPHPVLAYLEVVHGPEKRRFRGKVGRFVLCPGAGADTSPCGRGVGVVRARKDKDRAHAAGGLHRTGWAGIGALCQPPMGRLPRISAHEPTFARQGSCGR
jgi:hypothetical protein